jgi:hypothetical protein
MDFSSLGKQTSNLSVINFSVEIKKSNTNMIHRNLKNIMYKTLFYKEQFDI